MSKILYISLVILFSICSYFINVPIPIISIGLFIMIFILLLDLVVVKKITTRTLLALVIGTLSTLIIVLIVVFLYYLIFSMSGENLLSQNKYYLYVFVAFVFSTMYLMFSITFAFLPEVSKMLNRSREEIQYSKILDTSVIVDGRIADIAEKGFFDGDLIVPEFVIKEIQLISDSYDSQKRIRGRRALDVLNRMKTSKNAIVSITEIDFPSVKEVDLKLIELAKKMNAKVITNDFNLMKVASIHGVEILNLNDLANMMHVVVIPGDILKVSLIREGKENQALSYLEDGTMIVVDNARHLIGKDVEIKIENILPKEAGRVIFASLYNQQQYNQNKTQQNNNEQIEYHNNQNEKENSNNQNKRRSPRVYLGTRQNKKDGKS